MVALETLEGPDKNSSDPENGGRRLERVPGGWMVLNAEKYRNIVTRAASQEANRKRVARYRQSHTCNGPVRKANGPVMQSEAYTETEAVSDTEKEPEHARVSEPEPSHEPPRYDLAFASFRDTYPAMRRKGGLLVQQAYIQQCTLAGGPSALMTALQDHLRSAQWRAGKVPGMDVWLREERWRQSLPESEDQPQNKTISAAESLLKKLASGEVVVPALPGRVGR
jgi:hypothetical protein